VGGLVYMKAKKKTVAIVLMATGLIAFTVGIFQANTETSTIDNHTFSGNKAGRDLIINNGSPAPLGDTKQEVRSFLESLNPKILKLVDAGKSEIHVMIGTVNQVKLSTLSERQDFKKYLSLTQTGNTILGGNSNQIGDFINEENQNGTMNGFILYPKDALKR